MLRWGTSSVFMSSATVFFASTPVDTAQSHLALPRTSCTTRPPGVRPTGCSPITESLSASTLFAFMTVSLALDCSLIIRRIAYRSARRPLKRVAQICDCSLRVLARGKSLPPHRQSDAGASAPCQQGRRGLEWGRNDDSIASRLLRYEQC